MLLKYILRIATIAALFHVDIYAQHAKMATLTGKINDEKGEAVGFATIRIGETNIVTFSEADGSIQLKGVPYGHHDIVIT